MANLEAMIKVRVDKACSRITDAEKALRQAHKLADESVEVANEIKTAQEMLESLMQQIAIIQNQLM